MESAMDISQLLKKIVKRTFNSLGYEISKIKPNCDDSKGFRLYRFIKDDGSFNYESYKRIQIEGNRNKIDHIWVREENLAFLSDYIKTHIGIPRFGICHGTRRGKEQEWFRKYLGCEVIGTEISDTAATFPYTIQWDFHEAKPEWKEAADFIYSNSFDHSYDPEKCLNVWMSCIRSGGICIIEHSSEHSQSGASELDPFGADIVQMPYLILTWGKGNYGIRELLKAPSKQEECEYLYFIIIQKI